MDAALSKAIGETLRHYRAMSGDAVFDESRCESALLDMHKRHPAAIRAVLTVIQSGGAHRLLAADRALAAAAIEREVGVLADNYALSREYARGAVTAWAAALDLGLSERVPPPPPPPPSPPPPPPTKRPKHRSTLALMFGFGGTKVPPQPPPPITPPGGTAPTPLMTRGRAAAFIGGAAALALSIWALSPGQPPPPPPAPPPFRVTTLNYAWQRGQTANQRVLVVDGEVYNPASFTRSAPAVWVHLLDRNGFRVGSSQASARRPDLAPGGSFTFRASVNARAGIDNFQLNFDPP